MDYDIDGTASIVAIRNPRSGQMDKRTALKLHLDMIIKELAKLALFPEEDPCNDGDIIRFARTFGGSSTTRFEYAGLRVDGKYFLTGGRTSPQGYSWNELVEWLSDSCDLMYRNTGLGDWTQIVPVRKDNKEN